MGDEEMMSYTLESIAGEYAQSDDLPPAELSAPVLDLLFNRWVRSMRPRYGIQDRYPILIDYSNYHASFLYPEGISTAKGILAPITSDTGSKGDLHIVERVREIDFYGNPGLYRSFTDFTRKQRADTLIEEAGAILSEEVRAWRDAGYRCDDLPRSFNEFYHII